MHCQETWKKESIQNINTSIYILSVFRLYSYCIYSVIKFLSKLFTLYSSIPMEYIFVLIVWYTWGFSSLLMQNSWNTIVVKMSLQHYTSVFLGLARKNTMTLRTEKAVATVRYSEFKGKCIIVKVLLIEQYLQALYWVQECILCIFRWSHYNHYGNGQR